VPKVRESDTEGLESMQRLRSIAGDSVSKLWQNDISGELLRFLQYSAGNRLWKSEMQNRAEDWPGEMYKMWQASQMVNRIAAFHKKLCR